MKQRKDDEHVREINLVAAPAQQQKRSQHLRAAPSRLGSGDDHQARAHPDDCHVQPIPRICHDTHPKRVGEDKRQESNARAAYRQQRRTSEAAAARHENRGETPQRDRIHPAKIRVFLPNRIAMRPDRAREWTQRNEGEEKRDKPFRPPEQNASERKEKIKHLFDRQRPQNIPVARQISVPRLQHVYVKSQRSEQRPPEARSRCRDHEIMNIRHMQDAEHSQKREKQRRDARKAKNVEIAQADARKGSPAPQCGRRNQKSRNREENLHAILRVPNQRAHKLPRQPRRVWHFRGHQPHVDVIHQHKEDRERSQQIDAVEPGPAARWIYRRC